MEGGEDFLGDLTHVFIFGKRPALSPAPCCPALPSPPQLEMPILSLSASPGEEGEVVLGELGTGLGGEEKKFLFLNPCVSFA